MTDEEIDAFVRETMHLGEAEFKLEVAKLVRSQRKGWTLKAAAQLVQRAVEDLKKENPL